MRVRLASFWIVLLVALTATWANALAEPQAAYVVIVNPSNRTSTLDRKFLEEAFLKKITHWPNDEEIRPVDQAPSSPTRRRFSEEVLSRTVDAVKGYWQQRIFSGRDVPPPELDGDPEVVRYVLKHPGGVGYVSPNASLGGAKVVVVR